ncbi:MAG: InlB B-repeat-containing protein [Bacilli bacterium]|nr:InlB B-repeat-containing protein [Bacilli bacterium]
MKEIFYGVCFVFFFILTVYDVKAEGIMVAPEEQLGVICPTGASPHKIVYNTNGGNEIQADYVSSRIPDDSSLPIPEKDGYIFDGWYYDLDLTKKVEVEEYYDIPFTPAYDSNNCIKMVTTNLYAKWAEESNGDVVFENPKTGTTLNKIFAFSLILIVICLIAIIEKFFIKKIYKI